MIPYHRGIEKIGCHIFGKNHSLKKQINKKLTPSISAHFRAGVIARGKSLGRLLSVTVCVCIRRLHFSHYQSVYCVRVDMFDVFVYVCICVSVLQSDIWFARQNLGTSIQEDCNTGKHANTIILMKNYHRAHRYPDTRQHKPPSKTRLNTLSNLP